jgi:hypothetical protein
MKSFSYQNVTQRNEQEINHQITLSTYFFKKSLAFYIKTLRCG